MARKPILPKELKAHIQPLGDFQKTDCLGYKNGKPCRGTAKFEAYLAWGNSQASIRCCRRKECKEVALKMAETSILATIVEAGKI